jgi:hypothetical protein
LQRFISEDPIAFSGGDVNFYSYVNNNPITYIDPVGLFKIIWGLGYSAVVGNTGGERSKGSYYDPKTGEYGNFESSAGNQAPPACGAGPNDVGGLNVSADVFVGGVWGDFAGKSVNFNVTPILFSLTLMTNGMGSVTGFTAGWGPSIPPAGASGSTSYTNVA